MRHTWELAAGSPRRVGWQYADVRVCFLIVFLHLEIRADFTLLVGNVGRHVGIMLL
jgi:hypothetical protein